MQPKRVNELLTNLGRVNDDGEWVCDQIPISEITQRFGTPLFVYSGRNLKERIETVRNALGDDVDLFFSLKSNPSVGLCQIIASKGLGAELASIGEIHVARAAGFAPRTVIFAGPGKTDEELEAAVKWGIGSINVESEGELGRLARIAAEQSRRTRVCLRINPLEQVKGAQMRMGGGPNQFGIDEEAVDLIVDTWRNHQWVDIVGIHVYVGTQLFDVPAMLKHHEHVVSLAQRVAEQLGRPLEMINFGGGFAIPYFESSVPFDLSQFSVGFKKILENVKASRLLQDARVIIELGRYLVAEAGVYVTRVVDVKTSRGVDYVVTDGGMNHHIAATGNFGQVFRKPYPMAVLNKLGEPSEQCANIVGPCCTPLDVFGQNIPVPKVAPGDLVGVFYSGAYGYSAGSLRFLSHPTPAEVLVSGQEIFSLRQPGDSADVLLGQVVLDDSVVSS